MRMQCGTWEPLPAGLLAPRPYSGYRSRMVGRGIRQRAIAVQACRLVPQRFTPRTVLGVRSSRLRAGLRQGSYIACDPPAPYRRKPTAWA
jgi:hypothetical protein